MPEHLPDATGKGPAHQAAPGRALIDIPGLARALVEGGRRATIERYPPAGDEDVAWLRDGPVRQVADLQQGRFALRAAGVVIAGRAVALAGTAATGKSAVAATLALRGHAVLADSVLPVEVREGPVAIGATDRIGLWPEGARRVGVDPETGTVVRPALAKREHRFDAAERASLAAMVVLTRDATSGDASVDPIRGTEGFETVAHATAMGLLVEPLGLRPQHFLWASAISGAVPLYRLRANRFRRDLPDVADLVEGLVS